MEFKESNYSNLRIKSKHNCNTNLFALRNVEICFFSLAKLVELYNGPALGAQAGEYPISQLVKAAGFKHFKRATQTPFNLIYEANPRHVCLLTNSKHAVRSLILTQTLSFEIFTK
jgi:kynurenine formamidase